MRGRCGLSGDMAAERDAHPGSCTRGDGDAGAGGVLNKARGSRGGLQWFEAPREQLR